MAASDSANRRETPRSRSNGRQTSSASPSRGHRRSVEGGGESADETERERPDQRNDDQEQHDAEPSAELSAKTQLNSGISDSDQSAKTRRRRRGAKTPRQRSISPWHSFAT